MALVPVVIRKWIAALESGEYKQTRRALRRPKTNACCCLGVLANLHAQAHKKWAQSQTDPTAYDGSGMAGLAVREWSGLTADQVDWCVCANDSRGLSFVEIAAHFRQLLKEQRRG